MLAVLALVVTLLSATGADAQQTTKPHRIGFIGFEGPGLEWRMLAHFQTRLRELGWVEGATISTSYRWADGKVSAYPPIVQELVSAGVDVVVTGCGSPLGLIRKLDPTVPIVARCMDLKDFGSEIETPARPGKNTTGVTNFSPAATTRRLELLREVVPGLTDVGLLYRPRSDWIAHMSDIEAAGRHLGLRLHRLEWTTLDTLSAAFEQAANRRIGALLTLGDGVTRESRHAMFALAARRRLPVLYDFTMFPAGEDIGLMSYHVDVGTFFRTVAAQVDQILRGAKPGDIPIAEPRTFYLQINQRAARDLGLAFPSRMLQHADHVID